MKLAQNFDAAQLYALETESRQRTEKHSRVTAEWRLKVNRGFLIELDWSVSRHLSSSSSVAA